jgi:hypothetical protein
MENESPTAKKRSFAFNLGEKSVEVSGDFDSGNLNSARISLESNVTDDQFRKWSLPSERIRRSNQVPKHGSTFHYFADRVCKICI